MSILRELPAKVRSIATEQGWNIDTIAVHLLNYTVAVADERMPTPENDEEVYEGIADWFQTLADEENDEAADPEPVKTYGIQIGRDATAFYDATTTGTLSEIMNQCTRHGYRGKINENDWKENGCDSFDNVETVNIYDPETDEVLARWTQGDGWEESPDA